MTIPLDPRTVANVTSRKAQHNDDRAGAVCELVTAAVFGLRRLETERIVPICRLRPGQGRSLPALRYRRRT